jgi:acyl-CoA thioester hydrolase
MYHFDIQRRVSYSETDKMGYLYHGHFVSYFEVGRVEALRSLGLNYKDLEDVHGIWLPVMSLETRFVRPAYYDDLLTVHTEIRRLPDQYLVFHTNVLNEQNKLCAAGRVRLCFFEAATKKVVQVPDFVLEKLVPYF